MAFNLRVKVVRSFQDVQQVLEQIATALKERTVYGAVDTTGSGSVVNAGSGDWSVSARTGTGDVTIAFSPAFSGVPGGGGTVVDAVNNRSVRLKASPAASAARFQVFALDGSAQDNVVSFSFRGPR